MKWAVVLAVSTALAGCVSVPVTPEGADASKTFHTKLDFKRTGDCLYGKVAEYWSRKHPASMSKVDLTGEVRFEVRDAVPYAPREWMISVKAIGAGGADVRLYEGPRGIFGGASDLYDVALPAFVAECDTSR